MEKLNINVRRRLLTAGRLLALCALALAACAAPATLAPTPVPTDTPAPTVLPPTTAPTDLPPTAAVGVLATTVMLSGPSGVAFDASGNLFVSACADGPPQLYKVDAHGYLKIFASPVIGSFDGDGGPALAAHIACAAGVAVYRGDVFVADYFNSRIRKITPEGIISTVAGSGPAGGTPGSTPGPVGGFAGDGGPATDALLNFPTGLAFDGDGNMFILDSYNNRIRKVDTQGLITTFAGNGTRGFAGDGGLATAAELHLDDLDNAAFPEPAGVRLDPGIAVDAGGNVFVSDISNNRVRKIDRQNIITTVAGGGTGDNLGDGGPATQAVVTNPRGLAFDAQGNLYVASAHLRSLDTFGRVRKIDTQGIITTIAGADEHDFAVEGIPATSATLISPWGLAFDAAGNLYIADTYNDRVRKVGQDGIMTTVAGGAP